MTRCVHVPFNDGGYFETNLGTSGAARLLDVQIQAYKRLGGGDIYIYKHDVGTLVLQLSSSTTIKFDLTLIDFSWKKTLHGDLFPNRVFLDGD